MAGQSFGHENRLSGCGVMSFKPGELTLHIGKFPTKHRGDEGKLWQLGQRSGVDGIPVTQHRYLVADLIELLEAVSDEHHPDVLFTELSDDAEQSVNLSRLERRGRFVHNDHLRVDGHRPGDCHHLLDTKPQRPQRRPDICLDIEVGEGCARLAVHAVHVNRAKTCTWLAPQEDILSNGHQGNEVHLLVDGADTRGQSFARGTERHLLIIEEDVAVIWLVHTSQHLDQCRFARTVLSGEGMYFTGTHLKGNVIERNYSWECLSYAARFQYRG